MGTGFMLLEELPAADRPKLSLGEGGNVLRVKFVAPGGPFAAAKQAGFVAGDIVLSFDGKEFTRETDLLAYSVNQRKPGDKINVEVLRNGKKMTLTLTMQE